MSEFDGSDELSNDAPGEGHSGGVHESSPDALRFFARAFVARRLIRSM
jgi:hypothetical protein